MFANISQKLHQENVRNLSVSADKGNSNDILLFVDSRVEELLSKRLLLGGKISHLFRKKIVEKLIQGAQGVFLWVVMALKALQRISFQPDFEKALGQLPPKLSGLYDVIHNQIDQIESYGRKVAVETLKWLLCARRPLTVRELVAAISVFHEIEPESPSDGDDDVPMMEQTPSPEHDVVELCRGLVVIDSELNGFRFVHQSVQEYLLGRKEYAIVDQHALVMERCLHLYLSPKTVQRDDPLKSYAMVFWPVHYKYVEYHESSELRREVSRFIRQDSDISSSYAQWASDFSQHGDRSGWRMNKSLGLNPDDRLGYRLCFALSRPLTPLSAACAFGFGSFLKACDQSSTDWNQRLSLNKGKYTPLQIAAEEGQHVVVQLLLELGADVNARGGLYGNALQAASAGGYLEIVRVLLKFGADDKDRG